MNSSLGRVQFVSTYLLRALDKLVKELKLVGYVPDISLVFRADMEDEDKEITQRYHSEKLAIAFGLLNSPPGTKIQVVKNLWGLSLYSKLYNS